MHPFTRVAQSLARRASVELEHRGSAEPSRTTSELLQKEVRTGLDNETLGVSILGGMALAGLETLGPSTVKAVTTTTPSNSSYRFDTNSTQGRDDIPIQRAHRDRSRESQESQQESPQDIPASPPDNSLDHLLDDISDYTLSLASDRSATYRGLDRQNPEGSPEIDSEDRSTDLPDNPFDHIFDNISDSMSSYPSDLLADSTVHRGLDRQNANGSPKIYSEDRSTDLPDNPFDHRLDNISDNMLSHPSDLLADSTADRSADQAYIQLLDQTSQRHLQNPTDQTVRQPTEQALEDSHDSPSDTTLSDGPYHISNNTAFRTMCFHNDIYPIENETLSPAEEALKANFELTSHPISSLTAPPAPIAHAGEFNYIGTEIKGHPNWLWDSQTETTVETTPAILGEGYVAISYTWGRYRDGTRLHHESGTPWDIPTMKECGFQMRQLKDAMRDMPNARYFWVDVLCINQQKGKERETEIAKQGSIFKHAKGTMVYLWTIETAEDLARAMSELGELILMAVGDPEGWSVPKQYADEYGSKLRADYWYSSLWALQEMVLAPASTWITRDGSFCQLNGQALTTHMVAGALRVLGQLRNFSPFLAGPRGNPIHDATQKWLIWGLKEASLNTCVSTSRLNILLAGTQRKTIDPCRGKAILAALKVGYTDEFATDNALTGGMPVPLLNELMTHEGTALFDCEHSLLPTKENALTGMLPTTADLIGGFPTTSLPCTGWHYRNSGELVIPEGTKMHKIPSWNEDLSFKMQELHRSLPEDGLDSEQIIRDSLHETHTLSIGQVKFLPTGELKKEPPVHRGVILVTEKNDARHGKELKWHKAGVYYTGRADEYMLDQRIVIRADCEEESQPSDPLMMVIPTLCAVAIVLMEFFVSC